MDDNFVDKRPPQKTGTYTCVFPGCLNKIKCEEYAERPLYCKEHMKGREHRGFDECKPVPMAKPKITSFVMVCLKKSCRHQETISEIDYNKTMSKNSDGGLIETNPVHCPKCGTRMIWHKKVMQ